ncbi:hypothetical protein ACH4LN_26930 [Streptomyces albus]|uniref:Uncharacterized protein n=1 Tax=Streptomyces albus TaxID=1888 RepID=A0A8H1LFU7_9ACTN|nr:MULTISPECIES: hypothetical protein [Streptomyces]EPD93377.1 hypothetical protein HMPREF1486_03894 [Streptomyces sp. HPH0547]MDI6408817.1 hypothetical protein [Streptomyces albus]TGG85470.1 hypothetical protein D8771_09815 [Streptomyces albus]UVN54017.1 hypothetical protein NR995_05345 [Streptomyces albus]GHJ25422.1 hypothetical protein TPA0909_70360 [Streptomyces albus]
MSEQTPSQAEGERDDEMQDVRRGAPAERRRPEHPDCPRTTPSQAEGERDEEPGKS